MTAERKSIANYFFTDPLSRPVVGPKFQARTQKYKPEFGPNFIRTGITLKRRIQIQFDPGFWNLTIFPKFKEED